MSKSNDKRQRQLRTTSTIHTVTDTRKMSGDGDRFSLKNLNRFKLTQNIRRQEKCSRTILPRRTIRTIETVTLNDCESDQIIQFSHLDGN